MQRKLMLLMITAALTSVIVSGCKNNSDQMVESEIQMKEKTMVSVWYYFENERHQDILNTELHKFNQTQDVIEATSKYIPFDNFKKQLSMSTVASELPDIILIDTSDFAAYAQMGIFADLSGKLDTTQYYEEPLASCTLDGRLYGIPFGSNCLGLYYNKEMLQNAGIAVPETWEDLRIAAKELSHENISGIAFCSLQNEEGTFNFLPWLWSAGGDSVHLNNAAGIKALTLISDLVNDGSMNKEVINWTQGDVLSQFVSGNIAMMINGSWQIPTIRKQAPELKWDVAPIPKDADHVTVLGGEILGVIDNNNENASLQVVEFLTQKEEVKSYMSEFGYISARRDVAEKQCIGDGQMEFFAQQMNFARARDVHAKWPEISDAISLAVNEVITKSNTPENAAEKAQVGIDEALNDNKESDLEKK